MADIGDISGSSNDITYTNPVVDGTVSSASFWNPHLTQIKDSVNLLNDVVFDEITALEAVDTTQTNNISTNATNITNNTTNITTNTNNISNESARNDGQDTSIGTNAAAIIVNAAAILANSGSITALESSGLYRTNSDPGVNNDEVDTAGEGVVVGSGWIWVNTSTSKVFFCNDATATAAVWKDYRDADSHLLPKIGTPAWETVKDLHTVFGSAGSISGGTITANGTDFDVSAGQGLIRSVDDHDAPLFWMNWLVSTSNAIADGDTKYIGVEYNAGSPQVVAKATDSWNYHTEWPLGSIVREGAVLHILNAAQQVPNGASHIIERLYETEKFARDDIAGGLIIGETGTRYLTLSAGALWIRLNKISVAAIDTTPTGDTYHVYIRDGAGGWIKDDATFETGGSIIQWPNGYYDNDAGSPTGLISNRYVNLWFYLEPDDGDLAIVLGQAQYTSVAGANAENVPATIPDNLFVNGVFLGRFIVQESGATAEDIQTVFNGTTFSTSAVSVHNNLASIQGGATNEYYHLTAAEQAELAGSESSTFTLVLATGYTGSPTISQTSNYVKIGKKVKLDGQVTITGGTEAATDITFTGVPFVVNKVVPGTINFFTVDGAGGTPGLIASEGYQCMVFTDETLRIVYNKPGLSSARGTLQGDELGEGGNFSYFIEYETV